MNTSLELYNTLFEVKHVTSQKEIDDVFKIRHQVYAVERGYIPENQENNETDEYDVRSEYCLLYFKPTGEAVGTARLVLPDSENIQESYPIQTLISHPHLDNEETLLSHPEISRFAITKACRKEIFSHPAFIEAADKIGLNQREAIAAIGKGMCLGLITELCSMCVKMGFIGAFAVLEPSLIKLISTMGIQNKKLGDIVDYNGRRQPVVFGNFLLKGN